MTSMYRACSILSLPPELLCEVFRQYTSYWDYSLTVDSSNEKYYPILRPMQVCSRWRNIALALPELFSSLHISFYSVEYAHNLDVIIQHLSRSGNAPLKLKIVGPADLDIRFRDDKPSSSSLQQALQLWHLLLDCSERWERVSLTITTQTLEVAQTHLATRQGDLFPCLTRLSIRALAVGESHLLAIFRRCPQLSSFFGSIEHSFSIEAPALTCINLYYTGNSLAELFCQCPLLQVCTIRGYRKEKDGSGVTHWSSDSPYHHTHLVELNLISHSSIDRDGFLSVCFPNLKVMALHKSGNLYQPADLIALMLTVSKASLQRLKLSGYQKNDALAIISTVPSISHLEIAHISFIPYTPDSLYGELIAAKPTLAPSLLSLTITYGTKSRQMRKVQELVSRVVESRCTISPLGSVLGLQQFTLLLDVFLYYAVFSDGSYPDRDEESEELEEARRREAKHHARLYSGIQERLAPLVDAGLRLDTGVLGYVEGDELERDSDEAEGENEERESGEEDEDDEGESDNSGESDSVEGDEEEDE